MRIRTIKPEFFQQTERNAKKRENKLSHTHCGSADIADNADSHISRLTKADQI